MGPAGATILFRRAVGLTAETEASTTLSTSGCDGTKTVMPGPFRASDRDTPFPCFGVDELKMA
jgi:hypothetical protein